MIDSTHNRYILQYQYLAKHVGEEKSREYYYSHTMDSLTFLLKYYTDMPPSLHRNYVWFILDTQTNIRIPLTQLES